MKKISLLPCFLQEGRQQYFEKFLNLNPNQLVCQGTLNYLAKLSKMNVLCFEYLSIWCIKSLFLSCHIRA